MNNSAEIKAHSLALANKEIEPVDHYLGICGELEKRFRLSVTGYKVCFKLKYWPERRAPFEYPIGGPNEYLQYRNRWNPDDEYGARRLRACRWLAENWDTDFSEVER